MKPILASALALLMIFSACPKQCPDQVQNNTVIATLSALWYFKTHIAKMKLSTTPANVVVKYDLGLIIGSWRAEEDSNYVLRFDNIHVAMINEPDTSQAVVNRYQFSGSCEYRFLSG